MPRCPSNGLWLLLATGFPAGNRSMRGGGHPLSLCPCMPCTGWVLQRLGWHPALRQLVTGVLGPVLKARVAELQPTHGDAAGERSPAGSTA